MTYETVADQKNFFKYSKNLKRLFWLELIVTILFQVVYKLQLLTHLYSVLFGTLWNVVY